MVCNDWIQNNPLTCLKFQDKETGPNGDRLVPPGGKCNIMCGLSSTAAVHLQTLHPEPPLPLRCPQPSGNTRLRKYNVQCNYRKRNTTLYKT
jgi:hypothetical protein